jgi:hypothetical protein
VRLSILCSGFTLGAVVALTAGSALAAGHKHHEEEESEYPVSYVERPLVIPRMTLAPQLSIDVTHVTGLGSIEAGMALGAAFGVTKDLELGAVVLPLTFSPSFAYGNLELFGTYRFVHNHQLDVGGRLRVAVLTPRLGIRAGSVIEPSVPLLLHIGKSARLDAELGVPISLNGVTGEGATLAQSTFVGLDVPVAFSVDIIEPLHVGVRSGVQIFDLGHPKAAATIPLGFFAGYAVGGKKPVVDIDPFFTWTSFLTPGGGAGNEKINPGNWTVGLEVRAYIYL